MGIKTALTRLHCRMKNAAEHKSIPMQVYDLIAHKIIINTDPFDYYEFGFYKSDKSWEEKSRYIGIRGSRYYPYENNPLKFNILFTNKYVEKLLLKGAGLPTPELLTTIGVDYEIRTQQQLEAFLSSITADVVFKPISGAEGKKIIIVSRQDDTLLVNNKASSIDAIWNHVSSDLKRGFILEEKQINPPQLSRFFPNCLNTYRVITIKTNDGKWHLACITLKMGTGNNVVDNYAAGGAEIYIDKNGVSLRASSKQLGLFTHHPDTNAELIGIELEGYHEVIDLALRASKAFGFMGTFGWDIAFTPEGAKIIEGNLFWGSTYPELSEGMVTDEIAKGLTPRHMFSKWNKQYMHPRIDRSRRWPWRR